MAIDIDKFVHDQLSVWPAVAAKYRALKSAQTRQMSLGGLLVTLQSNPGRLPVIDHGCPLCEENYLDHQHSFRFEGRKGRQYNVLVNRAPIFHHHTGHPYTADDLAPVSGHVGSRPSLIGLRRLLQ